jgi:ABC-type uncharacterized transport system involved in gliding motility auxiliary subunit
MKHRYSTGSGLLLACSLFIAVNLLANQTLTSWRLDVTQNKLFTLSPGTRNILAGLQEPITLRYYFSNKLFSGIPQYQNYGVRVRDLLEEYAAKSHGNLKLTVIDPEPFSEAEDQAVGYGMRQLPVTETGDMAYFGLVGANTTDDTSIIPFFQPTREEALEYDLTKLIYNLAHPKKRVIGVLSTLPLFGGADDPASGRRGAPPWTLISMMREVFDVRQLRAEAGFIDNDIDTLMVVHPKDLPPATQYAIDQFVLKGGKAMVFIDPFAEADEAMPDPNAPATMPKHDSNLPEILRAWGIKMVEGKIAADREAAVRAAFTGNRGPQEVDFLPWLGLKLNNFNHEDFITGQLKSVNLGSAGALEKIAGAATQLTPLLQTGPQSGFLDAESVMFVRDPGAMLQQFKPDGASKVLAARITGHAKTAFPSGKPKEKDGSGGVDAGFAAESTDSIHVIVVADTDIISDRFWVRGQNVMGVSVPTPIADNADFVINALDNLGGNDDLISLRSRGQFRRPFTVVEHIQREAEAQFRDKAEALQARLEETEKKIRELQQQKDEKTKALLSPAQKQAIDKFKAEQVVTRRELRDVQHDLRKNIESLGTLLRVINIGLIPLVLGCAAITAMIYRFWRRRRQRVS